MLGLFVLSIFILAWGFRHRFVYWSMLREAKRKGNETDLINVLRELDLKDDKEKASEYLQSFITKRFKLNLERFKDANSN